MWSSAGVTCWSVLTSPARILVVFPEQDDEVIKPRLVSEPVTDALLSPITFHLQRQWRLFPSCLLFLVVMWLYCSLWDADAAGCSWPPASFFGFSCDIFIVPLLILYATFSSLKGVGVTLTLPLTRGQFQSSLPAPLSCVSSQRLY